MEEVLKVERISKKFEGRKVLDDVSFGLQPGERLAIMGPSGSGKTTLINCIGGIENPSEGEIQFNGRHLNGIHSTELSQIRKQEMTHVFQFFHLLPHLTLRENISLPLMLLGIEERERKDRVGALMEEVSITHRADAFPTECSGGEMQRAAIARALVVEPRLMLADEPTGNLDTANGDRVLELIQVLSERHGTAVILVTHSEEAIRICSRVIRIRDGRIESDTLLASEAHHS